MQSTICLHCVWYECVAQCDAVGVWVSWANVCVSEVFEIGGVGPLDEEEWGPCYAESIGWSDLQGNFCCLQRHGTCPDRRAPDPVPLLVEDGETSDTRNWERNKGGAPLAHLCRFHAREYQEGRLVHKCAESGCWHVRDPTLADETRCPRHQVGTP